MTPKPPWRQRKQAYLDHLNTAEDGVLLVSLADKLHNARSIVRDLTTSGAEVWTRFSAGRDQQLWYYDSLAAAFTRRLPLSPLTDELRACVQQMRQLA